MRIDLLFVLIYVKSCLHCRCTETGKIVPRPLGYALHAALPNKLLHFDYCYMSEREDDYLYTSGLKDDHSGYVWSIPTKEADAITTANALIKWFAVFGVLPSWVSDRGSHFKNELIKIIRDYFRSNHHFTLKYCSWFF